MRPRFSVFIATSLDGFIARTDGSIDWLEQANGLVPEGEDCGYGAFFETVDCLVMGRNTFETVLGFETWPYGTMKVVVLTSRPLALPPHLADTVSVSDSPPGMLAETLGAQGVQHVYLDGGNTISRFLAANLVDEMTITTIPVLIGSGRPLFGPLGTDIGVKLEASKGWDFGFVQNRYSIATACKPAH